MTLAQLWNAYRGCENAFRYYADVVGAIGGQLPGQGSHAFQELDPAKVEAALQPYPLPGDGPKPCFPPFCDTGPLLLRDGMQHLANRVNALNALTHQIVEMLPPGTGTIHHYLSELPGTHWKHGISG
jgi:hypothetical protein